VRSVRTIPGCLRVPSFVGARGIGTATGFREFAREYLERGCIPEGAAMDKHDRELLDKQVGRLTPARRGQGMLMVAIAGVFLFGIIVGGLMLARNTEPRVHMASNDGTAALSFFLNGIPATR
jgi:hypothetical protein